MLKSSSCHSNITSEGAKKKKFSDLSLFDQTSLQFVQFFVLCLLLKIEIHVQSNFCCVCFKFRCLWMWWAVGACFRVRWREMKINILQETKFHSMCICLESCQLFLFRFSTFLEILIVWLRKICFVQGAKICLFYVRLLISFSFFSAWLHTQITI